MASTTDWKQLPDSIIDPITLEPINELKVEPFKINKHYFDGEALAAYLVASSTFENPLDRKALTRDDCQRLDAHLARNKLKRLGVERERRAAQRRATRAARRAEDEAAAAERRRADAARATAAALLDALYARRPRRRQQGPAVIDDDEIPPDVLASAQNDDDAAPADEDFPALGGGAAPPFRRGQHAAAPEAFPALNGRVATGGGGDWYASIAATRVADDERRAAAAAREADAAAAADAAYGARAAAYGVPTQRRDLASGIAAVGRRSSLKHAAAQLWSDELLTWARKDPRRVKRLEKELGAFVADSRRTAHSLRPMRRAERRKTHAVCEVYGVGTRSYDRSPERHIRILREPGAPAPALPDVLLSEAAALPAVSVLPEPAPALPEAPPSPPKPPRAPPRPPSYDQYVHNRPHAAQTALLGAQLAQEDTGAVDRLAAMGFSRRACEAALLNAGQDETAAVELLLTRSTEELLGVTV